MIYFLIPVFNECDNLEELKLNLTGNAAGYKKFYVFVDDGSTDSTVDTIGRIFQGHDFIVLGDGKNYGPGYAFNTGFNWILENSRDDTDIIVTMEADNTSDIKILDKMIAVSGLGYGLVLASVYAQGGGFEQTSFMRKFLSAIANLLFRFIFDVKILTLSSFYRVYHLKVIREIKSKYNTIIGQKGFIAMLEILLKAIDVGAEAVELPMVLHSSKRKGKSKMKVFRTFLNYAFFMLKFKRPAG